MNKALLRQEFLKKRKALSADEVNRRSELIAGQFFHFLEQNYRVDVPTIIHTFLPIQRQNEIDTWLIIRTIWENYSNLTISVPVTDPSTNSLRHYPLFPETVLADNRWGIPEPVSVNQPCLQPDKFDIVLVPLLVFDKQGHRVGYGGGFYDRFLANCRPNCLKAGLSLFEPVNQIDGIEPTDIKLNTCVTPNQIYQFK
ncbi:5-formyltetrahydrofolate cyclo-ligase [Spirosoma sp. KNUC1025]|uniref:5-formyltetrahydrofolate cyclo-ligase n=1 Tax=Spirosoma sp. KNUC1025 TaxID=2894082 RepID=UPI00386A7F49|nr:5-formyltetrahydrofolate cyclo-ligase [Spirosoma sp. KNUC1025]